MSTQWPTRIDGDRLTDAHGLRWQRVHSQGEADPAPITWWETNALGYRLRIIYDHDERCWAIEQHDDATDAWHGIALRNTDVACREWIAAQTKTV